MPGRNVRFACVVILAVTIALTLTGFLPETPAGVAVESTATPLPDGLPGESRGETPGALTGDSPEMPDMLDRLAQPTLPADPDQADLGGQVYYFVCMACHGDQGQGLSPEWVEAWDLGDLTCWSSKCHASNHPPEGFVLPKFIPAVVSPAMVARFETALDLHDFLVEKMPWHAPGSLQEEEYWQVTAYLLRANQIDPGELPLNEQRAASIRVRPPLVKTAGPAIEQNGFWWVGLGIVAIGLLFLLVKYLISFLHR